MPEEEFAKIAPANKKVFEVYRFEELFAILIDNFLEFNKSVLAYADKARLQMFYFGDYFQKRIDINRAALNFFSTLFMYRDFIKERIKEKIILDFFKDNREFVRCLVMRNYIQHVESFPIISNVNYARCDINVELASVRFQIEASKLKKSLMNDDTRNKFHVFFDMDEKIDLYEIINQGMGQIQLIQKQIREMPLYSVEYKECKDFLLEIENKIARTNPCLMNSHLYIESDGDSRDWKPCVITTDAIKFIDKNIECYPCNYSSSNRFITTAPQEFVKKCSDKIFSPAVNQKLREEAREQLKGNPDA